MEKYENVIDSISWADNAPHKEPYTTYDETPIF